MRSSILAGVELPDLTCEYDEGYFDKDEQGWCARRVAVTQEGGRVTIREWGDDNGARPYDRSSELRIGAHWPEQALVRLDDDAGRPARYFDLATRRLRSLGESLTLWFTPPADYRDAGCHERAAALLVPVARLLGLTAIAPAGPITLPALAPSPTASGSSESSLDLELAGARWHFLVRDFQVGESSLGPQLDVSVAGAGVHVSIFVESPQRAMFLLGGPLERYPAASTERDRQLAAWLAC